MLDTSKLAMPTSEEMEKCAALAELNARKASNGGKPFTKAI